ncbi:hypothetical protein [Novosphingobium sp. ST904]|uniref:hypothetical protein n=1 Tax=Novosphingobium sp. ST904 TaxID=1684385 RepID=UPI0006C8343E|nr:hypothetical protein [Novosphingobium sp. ST904]TCM37738.1 hypothetical protein EDF59_110134 [Novosphingobium sp. ST904]
MSPEQLDKARRQQIFHKCRGVFAKDSTAVAYIYEQADGAPCAAVFTGRALKPAWRYRFRSAEERACKVTSFFAACTAHAERQAKRAAERKAEGRGLVVGDVLSTCWGYEQTNREWFEVTALIGKTMVEVREIAREIEETDWQQGKTVPLVGKYIGEPLRRAAKGGRVRIDNVRLATFEQPLARIGGKAVYAAQHFTAYH